MGLAVWRLAGMPGIADTDPERIVSDAPIDRE